MAFILFMLLLEISDTLSRSSAQKKIREELHGQEVYIEAGNYYVGRIFGRKQQQLDTYLKHANTSVSAYWIMKTEVTCGSYNFTKRYASQLGYILDNLECPEFSEQHQLMLQRIPVSGTSWWNAIIYANALSALSGLTPFYVNQDGNAIKIIRHENHGYPIYRNNQATGYRLPTYEEWQIAARGGVAALRSGAYGDTYSGSNDGNHVAWHRGNSGGELHAVATKNANQAGIHDMSGNVSEWTDSIVPIVIHAESDLHNGPQTSPQQHDYFMALSCGDHAFDELAESLNNCDTHSLGYRSGEMGFRLVKNSK